MIVSSIGGFLGIFLIEQTGRLVGLEAKASLFLIGSFGASAVLVYGVPQAPFSQPHNLIGGHCISALIGMTIFFCWAIREWLPVPSPFACQFLRCNLQIPFIRPVGPPALIAVIGGSTIHDLGYWYVLCPVALGACIMVGVAWGVNNLSGEKSRKYPHQAD
jgi:CBS-domain-containing membrane protein